jgi:DNA (cytosine-5)-methyltransferase 1
MGLNSDKRNYTVLKPDGQSPTVVTLPDDFIHYHRHRAPTVREMARLQSLMILSFFREREPQVATSAKQKHPSTRW